MSMFIIMHETVAVHDAIGNDIELMYQLLNRKHTCRVFTINRLNNNLSYISERELDAFLEDPKVIIIYHHSVYWELGLEKVQKAKGTVIYRYHNITPETFFDKYDSFAYSQCKMGREQTLAFQKYEKGLKRNYYWLCDSSYNVSDLKDTPAERIGICPPFNKIEEWGKVEPDEKILKELVESENFNILFVGRVVPNKGHLKMIEVLRYYSSFYGDHVRLKVIGKFDSRLVVYNQLIKSKIEEYGLSDLIEFIGEINDSTLMAYYLGCDAMLCCSEHEGFCVPIVEAQYFGLPIVAMESSAVPETIGPDQLVYPDETNLLAAALKITRDSRDARNILRISGRCNYENRFAYHKIKEIFEREILRMTGIEL